MKKSFHFPAGLRVASVATGFLLGIMGNSPVHAQVSVPVTWTTQYQSIDGFGAAGAYPVDNLMAYTEPARSNILDALFSTSTGAGLTILRSEIGAGDGLPLNTNTNTIEPSQGVWNYTGDAGQKWLMTQALSRGASKLFGTAWSPPAWMKTNNSVLNGGALRTDMYAAYATYLANYALHYTSMGYPVYAVSLTNEPDNTEAWQSCTWTSDQIRDFLKNNLAPTFSSMGVTAKVIAGEPSTWTESWALSSLLDPAANARVDIVGSHYYNFYSNFTYFTQSKANGKQVWETEISDTNANNTTITDGLRWANDVHNQMTQSQSNAYLYWLAVTAGTDGEALINLTANNTYLLNKRLFTLGNFSRFVRPGFVRIDSPANPASGINTTAYRNPANGSFAVVAINNNASSQAITISPLGFTSSTVTPYTTSATQNLAQGTAIPFSGSGFTATLPAQSVTTFAGTGTAGGGGSTMTDQLNDFTKIYAKTANWTIDGSNPDARFENDTARATRLTDTDETLTYNITNMTSLNVRIYFWNGQGNNIKLWASSTNGSYTLLTAQQDTPVTTIQGWARVNYSVASLPANTNFLMIEAPSNGTNWTPQISEVRINYTSGGTAPSAPTGLTATAGNTQVALSWTASSGATSYNVLRSTVSGSGYASVATGIATTSYTNTGLTNGTTYYYVVTATNSTGTSGNSNQASATPSGGGGGSLTNASFETPALAAGAYQYNPAGGTWTFAGNSGIANNGSGFTNPAAPNGTQVAFLQGQSGTNGSISQSVTFTAGNDTISFQACQRNFSGQNTQSIKVTLDGTLITTISPTSTSFAVYTTPTFAATAGAHTIAFTGGSTAGDQTAFIDSVAINAVGSGNTHSGAWAAKAAMTTTPTWNNIDNVTNVVANSSYTANFWLKGSGAVVFRIFNGVIGTGTEVSRITCNATSTWQQFSINFATGSNTQMTFNITDGGGIAGTAYIDDCFMGVANGTNVLGNPGFESGNTVWAVGAPFSIVQNP